MSSQFTKVGGKCPNGEITYDQDYYTDSWDLVSKQLEDLGFRVIGFDPGFVLCDAKTNSGVFDIPVSAVMKFLQIK